MPRYLSASSSTRFETHPRRQQQFQIYTSTRIKPYNIIKFESFDHKAEEL